MQNIHASPRFITYCPACLEVCAEIHSSKVRHKTISTDSLTTQISSLLNQNCDKWLNIFEKLETSIQNILQEVTNYLQNLDHTVNQYRNMLILNQHKAPKQNQQAISKAISKLSEFEYKKISCDQINLIMDSLEQSKSNNDLDLNEQFQSIEEKIHFDLQEIVNVNFGSLKRKSRGEDIQIIQPFTTKETNKGKTNIFSHQQQSKELNDGQPQRIKSRYQRYGYWESTHCKVRDRYRDEDKSFQKCTETFLDKQNQKNHHENMSCSKIQPQTTIEKTHVDQPQIHNMSKTKKKKRKERQMKIKFSKTRESHFSCVVKILMIIEKKKEFFGKKCTSFLAGDRTGAAIFVLQQSPLIEVGNNIKMENVVWVQFIDDKIGRSTKTTKISLSDKIINEIGLFRMDSSTANIFNERIKQIQDLIAGNNVKKDQTTQNQPLKNQLKEWQDAHLFLQTCTVEKLVKVPANKVTFNMEVRILHIIEKNITCQGKLGVSFLGGDEYGAAVFIVQDSLIVKVGNALQLKSVKVRNINKEKIVKIDKKTNSFIVLSNRKIFKIGPSRFSKTAQNCFHANRVAIQDMLNKSMLQKDLIDDNEDQGAEEHTEKETCCIVQKLESDQTNKVQEITAERQSTEEETMKQIPCPQISANRQT